MTANSERLDRLPDIQSYTARDFSTILRELEDWIILNKPELWSDFFESNLGKHLIDLIAYHGDLISFAVDRVAEESFLPSCRLYKSALKHAQLLAYKPYASTAASVDLRVSPIPAGNAYYAIQVLKGTQIKVGSNLVFEVIQDYNFPVGSTEMVFSVAEGTTVEEQFESAGTEFMEFTTETTRVIDGSWVVKVGATEWTEVEFVELNPAANNIYSVTFNGDRSITVRFGNGVTGALPPVGATITISVRFGGGEAGNVPARTIATSVPGVMNGQQISLNVLNEFSASGGADREPIDHIKIWAPLNVKTVDKAITRFDYEVESASYADPAYGAIARASAKLRVGTLAVPDPGPTEYVVVEEYTTTAQKTAVQSLGHQGTSYNDKVTMGFQLSAPQLVSRISFYIKKIGLPGKIHLRIETDDAGKPSGLLVDPYGEADISESSVYGTGWLKVRLNSQISLAATTQYWIVLSLPGDPTLGHYYELYGSLAGGYPNGKFEYFQVNAVDSNTLFLCHADGTQNSTDFRDESANAVTIVAKGEAKVDTNVKYFGTGALWLNGAASYLELPDLPIWTWPGAFTTDFWFYMLTITGKHTMLSHGDNSASKFRLQLDHVAHVWKLEIGNNTYTFPMTVLVNTWYHMAVVRDGAGNIRLYQDGVLLGAPVVDTTVIETGSRGFFIGGGYDNADYAICLMDEIRMSDNVRWAAPFPVPTVAYGGSWIDGTEIVDMGFKAEIGGPHVVHADDPITFDGVVYKAKSEFEITGNNMAVFLDPNTVDIYVWAETRDSGGRRTYGPVSSGLKASLLGHLDARAVVCTISFIHDGGLVPIDLNLGDVYVERTEDLTIVKERIEDAIEEFFMDDTIKPGTSFFLSDFYDYIEEVAGVVHFVERIHYGDVSVADTEMITRGTITLNCVYPAIDIIRDITARY